MINYDTTIRDSISAQAAVCRDSNGYIIKCTFLISSSCSAIYGALAALLAVELTISLQISSFIIEGDSLNVTFALQQPALTQDWRISSIISHIHAIIPFTTSWTASHVNRSANFCAHHVANWAATRLHFAAFPSSPLCLALFLHVMEKISPSLFMFPNLVFLYSLCTRNK
jgi:hypothetical protein